MQQSVFADVEIPTPGMAMPIVGKPTREVGLKMVISRERKDSFPHAQDLVKNSLLLCAQGAQLTRMVMDDSDRNLEAEGQCSPGDYESIVGIPDATSDNGVNGHIKLGMLAEPMAISRRIWSICLISCFSSLSFPFNILRTQLHGDCPAYFSRITSWISSRLNPSLWASLTNGTRSTVSAEYTRYPALVRCGFSIRPSRS